MFQRFASLDALQGIGQNLLIRFLEPFTGELAAQRISLPGPNLPERLYFPAVAALFSNPASLPASLIEALSALEEMCHPECRRQMQTVLAELQFITPPLQNSITPFPDSPERFAIQAWLAFPALLAHLENYDLEVLRLYGPDALDIPGIPGILKTSLCEIETVGDNSFHEVTVRRADDIFACAATEGTFSSPIPATGRITRAVFSMRLADSPLPIAFQISTSDLLILTPDCDAQLVERWVSQSRFTKSTRPAHARTGPTRCPTPGAFSRNFPA